MGHDGRQGHIAFFAVFEFARYESPFLLSTVFPLTISYFLPSFDVSGRSKRGVLGVMRGESPDWENKRVGKRLGGEKRGESDKRKVKRLGKSDGS